MSEPLNVADYEATAATGAGTPSSSTNALTMCGSNCVPAQRSSSARAASAERLGL